MLFTARVIKKPKGNGISPEGCKKIDANLALPCNYFFALCRSLLVFFVGFVGLPPLLLLHIYICFMAFISTFQPLLAPTFEVPIYQGSFDIVQQCYLFVDLFLFGFYKFYFLYIFCKCFGINYLGLLFNYLPKI